MSIYADKPEQDIIIIIIPIIIAKKNQIKGHGLRNYDFIIDKVSKGAKIRNRYNQAPHLTQNTNRKGTNSHLDMTNTSQKVSPFPARDHKAQINGRAQRHNKHKTEKHKRSTKEVPPWNGQ